MRPSGPSTSDSLRLLEPARPARVPAPWRPLRIADVAIFYGERSGGIRTYLEAKAEFARRTGAYEHHLVVPGRPQAAGEAAPCPERQTPGTLSAVRHEQRSLRLTPSNGYRIPLGGAGMIATLREIGPDVVLLHDPFWTPRMCCRCAHELGATVIAVHHSSAALHAAGIPGPQELYKGALRRWYRRAYLDVDAVMSVVDPGPDAHRSSTLALRLGLHPEFVPQPDVERGQHVLYAGRLSREKGVRELLGAMALAREPWQLVLIGTGPVGDALGERAQQLGIADRVSFTPYLSDPRALAREYARAGCVVLPGAYETFGLVALEAAACGASVVTASRTPSASLLGASVETFAAGDVAGLERAIARARSRTPDLGIASELAAGHSWQAALGAELADVQRLVAARRDAPVALGAGGG